METTLKVTATTEQQLLKGVTIHSLITEVNQPQAWLILVWVTIQDTVLAAKDMIVTCHVPLWLTSYEHTRGSQSASQLVKRQGCVLSCLYDQVHIKEHVDCQNMPNHHTSICIYHM